MRVKAFLKQKTLVCMCHVEIKNTERKSRKRRLTSKKRKKKLYLKLTVKHSGISKETQIDLRNVLFVRLQNIRLIISERHPSCCDLMPSDASELTRVVTGWRSHPDGVQTSWCKLPSKSLRKTKTHDFQEEFQNSCSAETTPRHSAAAFPVFCFLCVPAECILKWTCGQQRGLEAEAGLQPWPAEQKILFFSCFIKKFDSLMEVNANWKLWWEFAYEMYL